MKITAFGIAAGILLVAFHIRAEEASKRLIAIRNIANGLDTSTEQNRLLKLLAEEITEGR